MEYRQAGDSAGDSFPGDGEFVRRHRPTPTPNGRGLERLDFRQVVNAAKEKVFPAVIFIKCVRESYERGDKSSQEVSGSGVLISADGEALSNWHVVEKAQQVRCLLYEGRAMGTGPVGLNRHHLLHDTVLAAEQRIQFDAPDLYFQRNEGVFVFGVKYPGNAADCGLIPRAPWAWSAASNWSCLWPSVGCA
jgi:hypothetical protein